MADSFNDIVHTVRMMASRGQLAAARSLLEPLLTPDQSAADVWALAALVERQAGLLADARALLLRAIGCGDSGARHHNQLGNVLMKLGDPDGADAAFATAIAQDAGQADAWINRGNLLIGKDDAEALRHLTEAVRLAPSSPLGWIALGKAHRANGDFAAALASFETAGKLDPARASVGVQIGLTHAAAGHPQRAVAAYDRTERLAPAIPELIDNRAAARLQLGDIEGAREEYDRLVSNMPHYAPGHRARARLYWEYQLDGDPFASLRAQAERNPGDRHAWLEWLSVLASYRQFEAVAEVAERAIARLGMDREIAFLAAVAESETGRRDAATARFRGLRSSFGTDTGFLTAFARHALLCGDPALAERLSGEGLASSPHDQLLWAYRGLAWRLLADEREHWLNDYERLVCVQDAVPPGEKADPAQFAAEIAELLRERHGALRHPADQSLRGGTQTSGALFADPAPWVKRIEAAARAAVARYVEQLPTDSTHPFLSRTAAGFRFSGSWSVRLRKAGFHIAHIHPEGWISSAFYFLVPDPMKEFEPNAGWFQLGAPPEELGLDISPGRLIHPEPGRLVLFPSYMWHGTLPFTNADERLTCAFDVVPTGRV